MGIAAVVVAVVSPILGTIADFSRSKKRFLIFFTGISVVATALLFFVGEGDVIMGIVFFIIAEIGYRAAQVFYDALLTDVSTPETIGSVSGKGWAIGMIGGIVALLIVLVPIQLLGNDFIHWAFLITAFIYLISSVPTFLWVEEKKNNTQVNAGRRTIKLAFPSLLKPFGRRNFKDSSKHGCFFNLYVGIIADGILPRSFARLYLVATDTS